MDTQQRKDISVSKNHLTDIYEKYKDIFSIKGIYFWGSITSDKDYVSGKSDIDSIAIISDDASYDNEKILRREVARISNNSMLKIRLIKEGELYTAVSTSPISKIIDGIEWIILLWEQWIPVVGKVYSPKDLPTLDQEVLLQTKINKMESNWPNLASVVDSEIGYVFKTAVYILYLSDLQKEPHYPFSYREVLTRKSTDIRRWLWDLRVNNYKREIYMAGLSMLEGIRNLKLRD